MFDVKGKHIAVTGGGSGIGLQCIKELLHQGVSKCAILDVQNCAELCSELAAEFGKDRIISVVCDVSDKVSFEDALKTVVETFGQLDVLVNNAGVCNELNWEKCIQVNFVGVINGTYIGMKYMGKDNGHSGGTIVNVASELGYLISGCIPVYSGTKHAVIGFTRNMADPFYTKKSGIRFLLMCPGLTKTGMMTTGANQQRSEEERQHYLDQLKIAPVQEPQNVASGLIDILKKGKNGSVWLVGGDNPASEVEILFNIHE